METTNDSVAQRYSGPSDNVVKYDPMWTTLWHRFSKYPVETSSRMFAPRALLDYAPPLPVSGTWRLSPSLETVEFSLVANEQGDFEHCNFITNYNLLLRRRTQIFVPEVWNDGSFIAFIQAEVIHPIMCFINGLRRNETLPKVSYRIETCDDDADCDFPICIQILMERADRSDYADQRAHLPRILFYPPGSFHAQTKKTPASSWTLSLPHFLKLQLKETTPLLITDFEQVFKVTKTNISMNVFCGEMTTCKPEFTLRYVLTSRIVGVIPEDYFDLDFESSLLHGCPNNPYLPEPSDEEVFATCHRHSDFDRYTLAVAPEAVPRFLRWKEQMRLRTPKDMEGDVISAASWAFAVWRRPFAPRYALESLPETTKTHLSTTRRLLYPRFTEALQKSTRFTVMLEKELTPTVGTRFARTFSCRLLQLDSQDVVAPYPSQLCVKIYDDSTGGVGKYVPGHSTGRGWLSNFYTENDMLQNEEDVYMRLRHAWGSTLPFYYGAHLFACSDGQERYGILMELVPKVSKPLSSFPESSQISFIKSARHAVRVLQYADVTQYDWSHNLDQLVVTPVQDGLNTDSQTLSCTLVDFGLARQGNIFYDVEQEDDYANMAHAITIQKCNEDGIPPSLMQKHYEPREPWDFLGSSLPF